MNLSVTFEKPGHRIKRRRIQRRKVPEKHRVSREEAMEFMKNRFQVKIV